MQPVRPMIEHMSIGVSNYARSRDFYDAVMAPLGFVRVWTDEEPGTESACWGPEGELPSPDGTPGASPFWIQHRADHVTPVAGFHLCFTAPSRKAVEAFYAAGLGSGGRDDGPPGLRPHYGEGYYAAFLLDPDGWKIEALTYTAA